MKCTGLCYQGRSACTTPAACGLTLHTRNSDGSSRNASAQDDDIEYYDAPPGALEYFFAAIIIAALVFVLAVAAGYMAVRYF